MIIKTELDQMIAEKFGTIKALADAAGLERTTVSRLLRRDIKNWKRGQIDAICDALDISEATLEAFFYDLSGAKLHK